MNEDRQFRVLADALECQGVPPENHALLKRVTDYIGIRAYYPRGAYLRAERVGDGPALNIAYGWTNGFVSEQEALAAAGDQSRPWRSESRGVLWGISHPENRIGHGGGPQGGEPEPRPVCPACWMELPTTGRCDCS